MIILEIGNSYTQVKGLRPREFNELRKLLSYDPDPQSMYYTGFRRVKYLMDKYGYFPTGLLFRVEEHLRGLGLGVTRLDTRKAPKTLLEPFKIDLAGKDPYPDQEWAAAKAVKAGRGGIVMPTGTGKSLVIALIIGRLNVRTLVVVPTVEIKKQLSNSLIELYRRNPNIRVENIDSRALKTASNYDCLIIDECHHAAASTYYKLNKTVWKTIYHRFFFTATFFRNQANEQMLFEGVCGQEIFRLSHADAVSKGYIVPVEAYYKDLPKQPTDAYTWRQVYSELIIKNDHRNGVIAGMLEGLSCTKKSALCLVKEIEHGELLSEMTGIPFANGQDEESRDYIHRFNAGQIPVIIGTTGILGEGVDTKPAEYIIIAGLGKAKSAFMQQVGRGVRNYPGKHTCKVILFRDASHKFTLRHFKEQSKILKEELGIEPVKL